MKPSPRRARRQAWLPYAAAWLIVCAAPAAAVQEPDGDGGDSASQQILRENDRSMLHPGDPLFLVGLEQGDNDLRSRTPALVKSNRAARQVDPEDAYRRALAVYEDGARFHEAPLSVPAPPRGRAARRAARPRSASDFAAEGAGCHWPWMLGVGMTAFIVVWVLKRRGVLETAS
jgi:hypothetical protein